MLAPVVLFVYNRPVHTRICLESLSDNLLAEQSTLYIYSDGPASNTSDEGLSKIQEIRNLIRQKKWCGKIEIIESEKNNGIGNSIINGVSDVVSKYGRIIVLEDDLLLSKGFLKYMNDALSMYETEEKVMHVSGYMFPVKKKLPDTFFFNATSCWGWGTWARAWNHFSNDSISLIDSIKNNNLLDEFTLEKTFRVDQTLEKNAILEQRSSDIIKVQASPDWNWDANWDASVVIKKGLCLHPGTSLVRNIGRDADGMHYSSGWYSSMFNNQKIAKQTDVKAIPLIQSEDARKVMIKFYNRLNNPPVWARIKEKILKTVGVQ
jgi:hypothetical protein